MASRVFSKEEENFVRLTMSVDVIKLPLIDILDCEIKPVDLFDTLQSSSLLKGKNQLLRRDQLKICFLTPPEIPHYNTFDVSLLYTLIRNLCPSLKPSQNWGIEPRFKHLQIGDDIERLRFFRNNIVHSSSNSISDDEFEALFMYIKSPIERMQKLMMAKGYHSNYEQKLAHVRGIDINKEAKAKERVEFIPNFICLKNIDYTDDEKELKIMTCVEYGGTARFKAVVVPGESLEWKRIIGNEIISIDINEKIYADSTNTQLVIQPVCMEDDGEYQAVLSDTSRKERITIRKKFFLHVMGVCTKTRGCLKNIDHTDDEKELKLMTCEEYGGTARFKVVVVPGESLKWKRLIGNEIISIDINEKKYAGSTNAMLVIQPVCMEDEGEYQAVLSETSRKERMTIRKNFFLHVMGDQPAFDLWKIKTEEQGISVQYKVHEVVPSVCKIEWTLNGKTLDFENKNYFGGGLEDNSLMIKSPTVADIGKYSCTVTNGVGTASKDVAIDIPHAEISSEKQFYFGSAATIASNVLSCPSLVGSEWQESFDGIVFHPIDINQPKYFKSSCNPENPLLVIPKVTFEDKHHYRLLVWNIIGATHSNTVYLDVTGGPPNITVSHRTFIQNHSIELHGNVFLYEQLHENQPVVNNVYWTKDGQEIDRLSCGVKYSKVETDDPSLIIFGVNKYDAGSYQLHATNAVGSTASDIIILGIPDVTMEEPEMKEDGTYFIKVAIKSIPEPYFVQWSFKEKNGGEFEPIDVNMKNFKGTSNSLPHPVLIIRHLDELKIYCFQIEVRNFIGSCKRTKLLDLTLYKRNAATSQSKDIHNHGNVSEKKTTREEHTARPIDTRSHEKVETMQRIPTEKELASVVNHIGADFYILGVQLGLTDANIEHIRIEYSHSIKTQILKILLYWKNKEGSQATIEKLLDAMKAHSRNVDIVEIKRIFQCDKV